MKTILLIQDNNLSEEQKLNIRTQFSSYINELPIVFYPRLNERLNFTVDFNNYTFTIVDINIDITDKILRVRITR